MANLLKGAKDLLRQAEECFIYQAVKCGMEHRYLVLLMVSELSYNLYYTDHDLVVQLQYIKI